ncbi:MAG: hypothetical protein AAGA60_01860 [Cyanobacteria bacterium P01_E01_bin.42]
MNAYIVTEAAFDEHLLRRLIPQYLLEDIGLFAAGGISAVKSFARSVVVRRQIPTVIVADAESVIPELIEYRRQDIQEIVEILAMPNTPVKVILAEPEIDGILFHDRTILSRLFGFDPSEEILKLAKIQPKQALEQLISQSDRKFRDRNDVVSALTNEDIEILREAKAIRETIEFLQEARQLEPV